MATARDKAIEAEFEQVPFELLDRAVRKAQSYLLRSQRKDGCWVGTLEADASVAAGYIPLMHFLTGKVDPSKQARLVRYVKSKQQADGSWSNCNDSRGDLSVTIQCYFALKLAGISSDEPFMKAAGEFVLSRGGVMKANMITRIWLSLFGQYEWKGTPSMPPELILFPKSAYFNIYEFASWSRATIVALMVVLTNKPICRIPESCHIDELYVEPESERNYSLGKPVAVGWKAFFLALDRVFKFLEKLPFNALRRFALKRCEQWIIGHQEADGSWGGIMLPWIYSLMALKSQGYSLDHPAIAKGIRGIDDFLVEAGDQLWLQPATSPVWDTAWSVIALADSGLPSEHPSLVRAGVWLLSKEIHTRGDWVVKNPKTQPGCWAFEFENRFYPDVDDTAVVPRALSRIHMEGKEIEKAEAMKRGFQWVQSMQSHDGGWAAFDRNNDKWVLANIPFADFMTPLDPTSPDITAHVLEMFHDIGQGGNRLHKALNYIRKEQFPGGHWFGRWGVNYIYGTGLVLAGLKAVGEDMQKKHVRKAAAWLQSCQNADGGWGESCGTYDDPHLAGRGDSAASQTAWALMGLIAAGEGRGLSVNRGIGYLISRQQADGSWKEEAFTGTGFPRAFYLRYDLYRIYFPLIALSIYRKFLAAEENEND